MAFVLINADLGAEEQLVKELKGIEHVKEANALGVSGIWV
jgi:hypothetical protein